MSNNFYFPTIMCNCRHKSDRSNIVGMSTIEGNESIRDIPIINSTNIAKLFNNHYIYLKKKHMNRKIRNATIRSIVEVDYIFNDIDNTPNTLNDPLNL